MFFIIANLPFLTITHLFGIETFIDSFKHPDSYQYIKVDRIGFIDDAEGYVLLQKATDRGYELEENDTILYYSTTEKVQQSVVSKMIHQNGIKAYYTAPNDDSDHPEVIYEYQIIGKIKARFDDFLWNIVCIHIWDISTDNLNAIALFSAQ